MLVSFPHVIEFSNKDRVLVKDVAQSLLANEQVVYSIREVLERAIPGLGIEKITVDFVSATTNSPLREALSAGILLTFQDDLKKQVPWIIESITGIHVSEHYRTLVTVVFIVVVIYGIEQAWSLIRRKPEDKKQDTAFPTIHGNYNRVIAVGGNLIGISPERLAEAVSSSFDAKQRVALAKQSLAVIRPAKREKGASLSGGGVAIDAETIEAAPSDLDFEAEEERAAPLPLYKTQVVIHATDKDHARSGWAGHFPGVWEKRIPLKLFPGISPALLFGKDSLIVDATIVYKRDDANNDVPEVAHVTKVYGTED